MEETPHPAIDLFKSKFLEFGELHGKTLLNKPPSPSAREPDQIYYGPAKVYLDAAEYFKDEKWLKYAEAGKKAYSNWALNRSGSALWGYWVFSEGLAQWLEKYPGDTQAKAALNHLLTRSAFANSPSSSMYDFSRSRENAYLLLAHVNANSTNIPKMKGMVENALSHFDQWFGKKSAPFVKSFMVGLSAYSLIKYQEAYPSDLNRNHLLSVLSSACNDLWNLCWVENSLSFKYVSVATVDEKAEPAPDLNQLISPMYYWVWKETYDIKFLDKGDKIFSGGVTKGYLDNPKQFNQLYKWAFQSIAWRKAGFVSDGYIRTLLNQIDILKEQLVESQNQIDQALAKLNQVRNIVNYDD